MRRRDLLGAAAALGAARTPRAAKRDSRTRLLGVLLFDVEASAKRLELLRELVPQLRHLLVVVPASRAPFIGELTEPIHRVARELDLLPEVLLAGTVDELRQRLRQAHQGRAARTVAADVLSFGESIKPDVLTAALLQAAVPAVFEQRFYVEAGGLASYRLNWDDQTRRPRSSWPRCSRARTRRRSRSSCPPAASWWSMRAARERSA